MNLLTETLPQTARIDGADVPIHTDFRTGIRFELLMQEDIPGSEKVLRALRLYFGDAVPSDAEKAVDAILWFYSCGQDEESETPKSGKTKQAYSFEQDSELFYASFLAVYGIDLSTASMHWWTFRALLHGLPADCELKKVMGYRVADLTSMSKAQRKTYEKLRKAYALKKSATVQSAIGLAERDRRMKEYVERRFNDAYGKNKG